VGLEGCLSSKTGQPKNGSDHTTSGPLFIFTSCFDLLVPYLLTLLLIGGRLLGFSLACLLAFFRYKESCAAHCLFDT